MRELISQENNILKHIVDLRKENKISHIADLQFSVLLRRHLSVFALKCNQSPKPSITIYEPVSPTNDTRKTTELWYNVIDFVNFIRELESMGFIMTHSKTSECHDNIIIYDQTKYKYDEHNDCFLEQVGTGKLIGKNYNIEKIVDTQHIQFFSNFAYEFEKYANTIIYPLPLALSYVKNGFNTDEQKYQKRQLCHSKITIILSLLSSFIAIIGLIISVISSRI